MPACLLFFGNTPDVSLLYNILTVKAGLLSLSMHVKIPLHSIQYAPKRQPYNVASPGYGILDNLLFLRLFLHPSPRLDQYLDHPDRDHLTTPARERIEGSLSRTRPLVVKVMTPEGCRVHSAGVEVLEVSMEHAIERSRFLV